MRSVSWSKQRRTDNEEGNYWKLNLSSCSCRSPIELFLTAKKCPQKVVWKRSKRSLKKVQTLSCNILKYSKWWQWKFIPIKKYPKECQKRFPKKTNKEMLKKSPKKVLKRVPKKGFQKSSRKREKKDFKKCK